MNKKTKLHKLKPLSKKTIKNIDKIIFDTIKKELDKFKVKFIPVDSEHFSIWSLIDDAKNINIEKVFITASGGPFNKLNLNKFKKITIDRKSTRLNSSHSQQSRMPASA